MHEAGILLLVVGGLSVISWAVGRAVAGEGEPSSFVDRQWAEIRDLSRWNAIFLPPFGTILLVIAALR